MSRSATVARGLQYEIYPKRYFDASRTWFAWNHLTASDVVSLREEPGFERQQIYFHLNHPIRYIRLVGLVVDILVQNNKWIILRLDDSSGTSIEVKTEVRCVRKDDTSVYPSNTIVDNLDVNVVMSVPEAFVDNRPLFIGTPIKVKGTIANYRNERQLKLDRIWIVSNTTEEIQAWSETAQWKCDVLSKPWVLTPSQRQKIDAQILEDEAAEREKERRKRALDAKKRWLNAEHDARKLRQLERHERRRKEKEAKLNHGALPGSHVLPDRITDS